MGGERPSFWREIEWLLRISFTVLGRVIGWALALKSCYDHVQKAETFYRDHFSLNLDFFFQMHIIGRRVFALKWCVESLNSKSSKARLDFRGSGLENLFIIVWNQPLLAEGMWNYLYRSIFKLYSQMKKKCGGSFKNGCNLSDTERKQF